MTKRELSLSGAHVIDIPRGSPSSSFVTFPVAGGAACLRRHGVTITGGSTAFYLAYLALQRAQPGDPIIPSLRLLSGGGAPMPPEVYFEVGRELGCRVAHGYGMTEVPMIAQGSPHVNRF